MPVKPETRFWGRVKPLLEGLDPRRIENAVALGTPDVNITLGWIELKVKSAPKRADTIFTLPHFTPEQREFLIVRSHFRGPCWLLLLVDDEWMLFHGATAGRLLGKHTLEQTRKIAFAVWTATPTKQQLQEALIRSSVLDFSNG